MTFYLLNATSLAKLMLSLDIKEHCPHVALVTETWFTNKHHTNCMFCQYQIIHVHCIAGIELTVSVVVYVLMFVMILNVYR